jgi:curved DNA-binding protein CbpA
LIDYYAILGVMPSAEIIVIQAAYRALAQKYHPDKSNGSDQISGNKMREINEAYAVLSDKLKREAYDAERKKYEEAPFDLDDEIRSAFEDAEVASVSDWLVAVEYYPDLIETYKRLKQTSHKLAFAYRSTLLDGKDFKNRAKIAENLGKEFFDDYFGRDPKLHEFARLLVEGGRRSALRELNRAISVLGKDADADLVIPRIKHQFGLTPEQKLRDLLFSIEETKNVEEAKTLIVQLGGTIKKKRSKKTVMLDRYVLLPMAFRTDEEFTDWVIQKIIPLVRSGL